jgi:hypothetical protein
VADARVTACRFKLSPEAPRGRHQRGVFCERVHLTAGAIFGKVNSDESRDKSASNFQTDVPVVKSRLLNRAAVAY